MSTTPRGLRALVVDWGGVLTQPVERIFDVWLTREHLLETHFVAVMTDLHNQSDSILHQVERGEGSREALERELAARLTERHDRQVEPEALLERMFAAAEVNDAMVEVLGYARNAGWRTAVLSNSWGNAYDEPLLESLVDTVLLSDRIGLRKPEPACYEFAAAALDISPDACVFVDDLRRNVRGAERVGMTALRYDENTVVTLRELIENGTTWT